MNATTMNTPQAEVLNQEILNPLIKILGRPTTYEATRSRNTVSAYNAICQKFRAMISETLHFTDYREQNLLNPNMGSEIRRKNW